MRRSLALFAAVSMALACSQESNGEADQGHTHGPEDDHLHGGEVLPATVIEGSVFYYHQLSPGHEAIQFARAHNPNFDEILAGGND